MTATAPMLKREHEAALDARIVDLPPLHVAAAQAPAGATPERDATAALHAWARANGLLDRPGARWFGFNIDVDPDDPRHGYEVWLTVPADAAATGTIAIEDFAGGRYAVAGCTLETMSAVWEGLWCWVDRRNLGTGTHQWLEEVRNFREAPPREPIFDLYYPIIRRPS